MYAVLAEGSPSAMVNSCIPLPIQLIWQHHDVLNHQVCLLVCNSRYFTHSSHKVYLQLFICGMEDKVQLKHRFACSGHHLTLE